MSQARFQKMQREKAKREKAEAKAERKAARAEEAEQADDDATPEAPEEDVLAALAKLHAQFDDDQIDFETFEERKQELIAKLSV